MKKILLYIILFLSGIDGAWALPIEKEGMSIYSPSLKQEVSYAIILPEGYEHSDTEYPVLYMFHGIGGDYTSWLEYGNVARVMDKMIKEGMDVRSLVSLWEDSEHYPLVCATATYSALLLRYRHPSVQKYNTWKKGHKKDGTINGDGFSEEWERMVSSA